MAYIGQPPLQEFTSPPTKDTFTGDGSTTTFDLAQEVVAAGDYALEVFIDNVRQEPGTGKSFTLGNDDSDANKRITFTAAPANGAVIYVLNDKTNLTAIAPTATDLNGVELILDADADTSITADTDDTIDIKIAGADDFQFTANTFTALAGSSVVVPESGLTLGSTAVTSTAAELNLLDGVSGLVQADLTKLAAVDATAAELNLIDGGTARGTTALASGDGILINDGGTMRMTNVDTVQTFMQSGLSSTLSGQTDVSMDITNFVDGLLIQPNSDGSAPTTGTLSSATGNVGIGKSTFTALTSGTYNTALGYNTLAALTTANHAVGIGSGALAALTTGNGNIGIGRDALTADTTGNYNIAIGPYAMQSNVDGDRNVAIGADALQNLDPASNVDMYNTAVGYSAGNDLTTGIQNTFIGAESGDACTTSSYNTSLGGMSFSTNTTGASNVAVGYRALIFNTTASNNTAVGRSALEANTTGNSNVAVGYQALDVNTTASSNTAVGNHALGANTTAGENTAVGASAGAATTTGDVNTFIGSYAGTTNTTGVSNTALGNAALRLATTASYNTALGREALKTCTTGYNNTAVGYQSMHLTTTGNGRNVAVGAGSMYTNTTGYQNVAVGYDSMRANTTGYMNAAVGETAMNANTTGYENIAVGYDAGTLNTTGIQNTFVGAYAGDATTTGGTNSAFGNHALSGNTTGTENVAVGKSSGFAQTTGTKNVTLGTYAGYGITVGYANVFVGFQAGWDSGNGTTTGVNCVSIGAYSHPSSATVYNEFVLGDGNISNLRCNDTSISALSDSRDKVNVSDLPSSSGLSLINALRPVTFNWDRREWYDDNTPDGSKIKLDYDNKIANSGLRQGFLAQEVQTAIAGEKALIDSQMVSTENPDKLELAPAHLITNLVKAIQELSAKVDAQQSEIDTLKNA